MLFARIVALLTRASCPLLPAGALVAARELDDTLAVVRAFTSHSLAMSRNTPSSVNVFDTPDCVTGSASAPLTTPFAFLGLGSLGVSGNAPCSVNVFDPPDCVTASASAPAQIAPFTFLGLGTANGGIGCFKRLRMKSHRRTFLRTRKPTTEKTYYSGRNAGPFLSLRSS
jgi:hypothetical protein